MDLPRKLLKQKQAPFIIRTEPAVIAETVPFGNPAVVVIKDNLRPVALRPNLSEGLLLSFESLGFHHHGIAFFT